jgi:hemin uptake protein HemP
MDTATGIADLDTEQAKPKFVMLNRIKTVDSNTLFSDGDQVLIQHRGEQYLLRRTRHGKLILTK